MDILYVSMKRTLSQGKQCSFFQLGFFTLSIFFIILQTVLFFAALCCAIEVTELDMTGQLY